MSNLNLMVGDWVTYKNNPYKIDAVSKLYPFIDDARFGLGIVTWDNIQPIPLSPEVMEKIEFKKNDKIVGSWDLELFRFHTQRPYSVEDFTAVTECYYAERDLFIHGGLKHLHQLQQLIRLFTGKEIVVKL